MRYTIVIPALNEAGSLPRLFSALPDIPGCQRRIIVVDNGSTDDTVAVAARLGAEVISESRRGYGWACHAGVQAAAAAAAQAVVFLDGDCSSDPAEIPVLMSPLVDDRADMVLGSRLLAERSHAMLGHQTLGNQLSAWVIRRLYKLPITDLSPFRAVSAKLLAELSLREMTFGYPTEMLVKAARRGARLLEVPVGFHPRLAGVSKVSGTVRGSLLAAYFILSTTLRYALP
jgi:glycosyltransferase involved in cell wall biosynthesis